MNQRLRTTTRRGSFTQQPPHLVFRPMWHCPNARGGGQAMAATHDILRALKKELQARHGPSCIVAQLSESSPKSGAPLSQSCPTSSRGDSPDSRFGESCHSEECHTESGRPGEERWFPAVIRPGVL